MAERKVDTRKTKTGKHSVVDHSPLFTKQNYLLMLVGAVIIGIGMFVMSGGKSADPNVFDYNEVYSTTRITVAPILIVLGLVIEVVAIFKKTKPAA
jgi:cadmium resistance protein CadD (predicted permease)